MQKRLGWCGCVSILLALAGCDAPVSTVDAAVSDAGVDTGVPPPDVGIDSGTLSGCELSGYPALDLETVATLRGVPTSMARADGRDEIFVTLRGGTIQIMNPADGSVFPRPFLDASALINGTPTGGDEWGLLGLAFHPDYATNGLFYIAYTADVGAAYEDRVAVGMRSAASPDEADAASVEDILVIPDFAPNHNGGQLVFGPDGFLYYGTGDGGGADDPRGNGQDNDQLLGKILRLEVGPGISGYGIPAGNPFAGALAGEDEIWATGLRNPWRFTFDRLNGDMFISDVGQDAWDEINVAPAGTGAGDNYGWNVCEGNHDLGSGDCAGLVDHHAPIFEYAHTDPRFGAGSAASIVGGYVYRGTAIPELNGAYLFGDTISGTLGAFRYCSGEAREVAHFDTLDMICATTTFGDDAAGEVYLGCFDGRIMRYIAL